MGKPETSFFPISQYSVRLRRTAEEGGEPLGSGTLLIRKEDETVWLLTCAHVFFLKSDPDDEEAESEFVDNVEVEYKAAEAGGRSVTVKLKEKNGDEPAQAGTIMAGNCEETLPCEKDFICVRLDWEDWMECLDNTQLGQTIEGRHSICFGFPNIVNASQISESGRRLETKSSNVSAQKFTVQYEHDPSIRREEEMNAFSGGGLFDLTTGQLVGILCQPYEKTNDEVWAVAASLLEKEWNRSQTVRWDDVCLVRRIHTPFEKGRILPSMRLTLNLFAVLSSFRNGAVIFLLNSEGKALNRLLNHDRLRTLIPRKAWKCINVSDALGLAVQKTRSLIVNMLDREQDWKSAEMLSGSLNLAQTGTSSKLVLFNIDLTAAPQVAPPNIQELVKRISRSVMGTDRFYLFSTSGFIESLQDPGMASEEELNMLCCQAKQSEDPYAFLLREAERQPHILPRLIAQCTRPGENPLLRSAAIRLAILYCTLTNRPDIHALMLDSENRLLLQAEVYSWLPADEKLDLLGRMAMDRPDENFGEQAAGRDAAGYDQNLLLFANELRRLVKKPVWSGDDLKDIWPRLSLPGAFRTLIRYLNSRNVQPEQDSWALLALLDGSRNTVLYWQLLLSCRWGTEALCHRIQNSSDGRFLSLLLDVEPDRNDGAWMRADSMRADLFGPRG